ncbi:MAG: hypothetical protein ACFB2W_25830 [Leptolyngbyaceae cyanobacterium]
MNNTQKPQQMVLDLQVVISKRVNGIEMGVLNDGTPFLTGRGLARVCGISNSTLVNWGESTPSVGDSFRNGTMAELLAANGFEGNHFFVRIPNGIQFGTEATINAYPDDVCMAFLEYYAFEAGRHCTNTARKSYRLLARKSLRDYIYSMTGYDPSQLALQSWKHFHDRLLLNPMPEGYFSVFSETAQLVLASIRSGLIIDTHTIPDISVGSTWSKYWQSENLDIQHGQRTKYPHLYPDYFPQAKANGDIEAYIYPLQALGNFRTWLESTYLPNNFPNYLRSKEKQGALLPGHAKALLQAVEPKRLKEAS